MCAGRYIFFGQCSRFSSFSNNFRGLLNELDDFMADEYVTKNALTLLDTTFIHREPYGLVLIIGPWNFPLQLSLVPMAGAIAAGNAVIVKPSELAPATAEVLRKTINKYMDQGGCILNSFIRRTLYNLEY